MTGCRMAKATDVPMKQTPQRDCQASGGATLRLAKQGFDFADFAAFLRRQDARWLIECATRSAQTPGTFGRDACESGDASNESESQ